MEEPVVKASDNFTKPKAGVDHCTSSPASRDRCTAAMVQAARYSSAKSRAEIASMELRIGRAKPSAWRWRRGRWGKTCRPAPRRPAGIHSAASWHPRSGRGRARTSRHRPAVMAEGHRLGHLHMGEARHDGLGMLFGLRQQRQLQRLQALHRRARRRRAPTAGNRSPPGRCANGRCAAARPPGRSVRPAATSILRWMSSSSRLKTKLPSAISFSIGGQAVQDRQRRLPWR